MAVYFREGKYKAPLSFIPGGEGSGHVEALGEGVADLLVGGAVAWLSSVGSYAEKMVVPADSFGPSRTRPPESCGVNDSGYYVLLFKSSDFCLEARSYRFGSRGCRRCRILADPDGEKAGCLSDCDGVDVRKVEGSSRGGRRRSHHLHPKGSLMKRF